MMLLTLLSLLLLMILVTSLKPNSNINSNNIINTNKNKLMLKPYAVLLSIISTSLSLTSLPPSSSSLTSSLSLLSNQPVYAVDIDNVINSNQFNSLSNVVRVQRSLSYIQKDVENGNDVKSVINQIKSLLRNYKLKDSISNALVLVTDNKRDEARSIGNQAVEDLVLVFEYFSDGITDVSTTIPPREILQLTIDATKAAEKELDKYLSLFPNDIKNLVTNKVSEEFQ